MSTPNADPKGPPLDGGGEVKKASKKSSSKRAVDGATPPGSAAPAASQLSTAAAPTNPTSPVPTLHDMPRLALAEPKGSSGGEASGSDRKARPAKKRTSVPDAEVATAGAGPSLPTGDAASAPKADAEAEKERARREAKKQRARELEEQRKREEIERLAIEEARKKEEQRQRELRRQQEIAALNANADVVQDEEDGGYGDEGFEGYDDDFETDDAPPAKAPVSSVPAKPLAKAKGVPRDDTAGGAVLDSAALKRIQEAQKAESKELASTSRPSSKSSKATGDQKGELPTASVAEAKARSPATSIAASIAGLKQTLDPRARRIKEIREMRKLDVEKFNVFVQAPMDEVDIYRSRLRRGNVRQVAVQTKDDDKSEATQTKEPELISKGMHFPDDVGIDDVTTHMKARRTRAKDNQAENDGKEEGEGNEEEDAQSMSSTRFLAFLEQSSQVCEQLIEENIQESDAQQTRGDSRASAVQISRKSTLSRSQLFPTKKFDHPGLEKLLEGRALVALRFSPAVSNVFVTWHGESSTSSPTTASDTSNAREDDGPQTPSANTAHNSIACVWDVNQLDHVQYVLQCESLVTSACVAPTRELLVLAGGEDGSVNVWDLRSRLSLAGRSYLPQYAVDVYGPTYSTCGADSRSIEGKHHSSIVSIQVMESTEGVVNGAFQFGSLDDRGMLLIWSVVDYAADSRDEEALLKDKCLAIGGRIKLVVSVAIDTQLQYLVLTRPKLRTQVHRDPNYLTELRRANSKAKAIDLLASSSSSSSSTRKHASADDSLLAEMNVGPIATTLSFFPDDPNQFLVGTTTGLVLRGNRYENAAATARKTSPGTTTTNQGLSSSPSLVDCYRRDRHDVVAAPSPTGIAVTCIAPHPFSTSYFLVGYEDGRVCLFDASLTAAIATWEDVDYDKSVTTLQWSPSRAGVFFASYSHGLVHAWDLTAQRHGPAFEHKLTARKGNEANGFPIALSSEKIRTSRPSIAMCTGGEEPFGFQVHELGTEFTTSTPQEAAQVEEILAAIF